MLYIIDDLKNGPKYYMAPITKDSALQCAANSNILAHRM
jgi:hypothetical protein